MPNETRPPLKPEQIDVIRRWIAEGAREDADNAPKLVIHREVEIKPRKPNTN